MFRLLSNNFSVPGGEKLVRAMLRDCAYVGPRFEIVVSAVPCSDVVMGRAGTGLWICVLGGRTQKGHSFVVFFSHPIYYLRPSTPAPSLVVTQIRGHESRIFFPFPTAVGALHFYREKCSAFSSLVDSRRIVPTHATYALSAKFSFPGVP